MTDVLMRDGRNSHTQGVGEEGGGMGDASESHGTQGGWPPEAERGRDDSLEPPEGPSPAEALIAGFWLRKGEDQLLRFNPPSLWCFVTAAGAN